MTMLCQKPVFIVIFSTLRMMNLLHGHHTSSRLSSSRGTGQLTPKCIWLWDKLGCGDAVGKVAATTVQFLL